MCYIRPKFGCYLAFCYGKPEMRTISELILPIHMIHVSQKEASKFPVIKKHSKSLTFNIQNNLSRQTLDRKKTPSIHQAKNFIINYVFCYYSKDSGPCLEHVERPSLLPEK